MQDDAVKITASNVCSRNGEVHMNIGFVGLGNMGTPMAANLQRAAHKVIVYNRTRERAQRLADGGATVASTPGEAAQAGVVITMLADDAAVQHTVFGDDGIAEALPRGGVHVSMSTISVALADHLSDAHAQHGQLFVSAPVFGRPEAAQAAKLFVVTAGKSDVLDKLQPIFDAVGQKTFRIGERPSMANVVKLSGNFLVAAMLETLGEAFALVRKYGIAPETYLDVLTNSLFNAPVYRTYGGIIAAGKYEPVGFRLALGLKDVRLALEAGEKSAVPMPVASVLRDRFLTGIANGMSDADWSSIAQLAARNAGLE
jgi:3-hydroxyisobutyrate dehydrogenase-like beta-hydroxyacid dehydrogenase